MHGANEAMQGCYGRSVSEEMVWIGRWKDDPERERDGTSASRREKNNSSFYLSILSILSSAVSTPRISNVTCRGTNSRSFIFSLPPSSPRPSPEYIVPKQYARCSCRAFSSAIGRLSVILVSLMVNRQRPMISKYDSSRKACCNSSNRVSSAWRAQIHVRQAYEIT